MRPAGQARRLQGPRGRAPRARGRRRGGRRPSSSACASRSPRSRPSSARPPSGDFVVIDFVGTRRRRAVRGRRGPRLPARARLGPADPGLRGAARGRRAPATSATVEVTFPDDYPAEHLAGKDAVFAVEVKEVKEKRLPELDDDFAAEAGGFDSLDELRADIETRIARGRGARDRGASSARRPWTPPSPGARSSCPNELVHAKAHEMWHRTARRLPPQGIDPRSYLADRPARPRRSSSTRPSPRPSRRSGARRCWPRSSRPRSIEVSDEELDRGAPRRRRAQPDASRRSSSSAAQARARPGRRRGAARGHRDAQGRRPARRERQADPASSRPRRARSSGRPRRRPRGGDSPAPSCPDAAAPQTGPPYGSLRTPSR